MAIKLEACSEEELKAFNTDLKELADKHSVQLTAVPIFVPESSTQKFLVDAQVVVMKKIEVPDEEAPDAKGEEANA